MKKDMSESERWSRERWNRLAWWAFVAVLGLAALYIAHVFVGLLVVGVFGYYATRPICRRLSRVIDSEPLAASATVLLVLVPILLVTLIAGVRIVSQVGAALADSDGLLGLVGENFALDALPEEQREVLLEILADPVGAVTSGGGIEPLIGAGVAAFSALAGTLLFLGLAISLSFFLLKTDEQLAAGFRDLVGGPGTTAHAYAAAVDEDLESVFFGNLLFVVAMSLIAAVVYWVTNLVAPAGLAIPMVFILAFLTGLASLIPVVVGKLVYLPVVGLLALQATEAGGGALAFVGGVLVVYFLLLDIMPQTFLQPYLSGRQLGMMLLMFGYILGPILFGWYGFFLLPIVFVVMVEAIRIPLPELVHGERQTPTVSMAESTDSDPDQLPDDEPGDGSGSEGDTSEFVEGGDTAESG
jgi:predicted PurR-regulated permease PerM